MNFHHLTATKLLSAPGTKASLFAHARRPGSLLYLALAVSIVAHALTYWATPHFISAWHEPVPPRFDAVIVTSVKADEPPTSIIDTEKKTVPAAARSTVARTPRAKPRARPASTAVVIAPSPDDSIASGQANKIDALQQPVRTDAANVAAIPIEPVPDPEPAKPAPEVVAVAATSSRTEPTPELPDLQFPTTISIDYKMTSSVANGIANLAWKRKGAEYEIDTSIQATGFFTSMFVGVFRQISRGEVTRDGVRPNFFSLQRGDAGADTAEFNRASKELKIIKHGETHLSALPERMQDMQSFLFQMAHDVAQLKPDQNSIDVQVTNARKVYEYKFRRVGEEVVQTRLGALPAIHLKSEAADPEDVYEVWLSPQHFYMPIKLKFFMGRFPIEQVASSLKLSGPDSMGNISGGRK